MIIKNIFKNPKKIYKKILTELPNIKKYNKNIMNKIHSLNKTEEFWWAITGEYALFSYYLLILSEYDPRILVDINNSKKDEVVVKHISALLGNTILRDFVSNEDEDEDEYNQNDKILDDLFVDNYKKNFESIIKNKDNKENSKKIFLPFNILTTFLGIIYFIKSFILNSLKKINSKIHIFLFNKESVSLNFNLPSKDLNFETIYLSILPDKFNNEFPKWFVKVSSKIISHRKKWVTYFGLELNVFQNILIATSYGNYGEKHIEIIPHGSVIGEINIWYIWRLSLFPNLRINSTSHFKLLKNNSNKVLKKGILYCPRQMPYFASFLSLKDFRLLMRVHKKVLKLFVDAVESGKNIKVKYKNTNYLRGYTGQFFSDETKLPVESGDFENIYQNYEFIVSMPHGSIGELCKFNKIPYVSFYRPTALTDRNLYKSLCDNQNIFNDEDLFLSKIKRLIDDLKN